MIIPSSSFASVSSIKKPVAAGGGGSDVTPNAVNWTEQTVGGTVVSESTTETITGINASITLRIQLSSTLEAGQNVYYIKNGGSQVLVNNFSPDYVDVSIVSGDTLKFRLEGDGQFIVAPINITNLTDANTLLDTVTLTVIGL